MPINKDLSDLPRSTEYEGNPPSKNPFVAQTLAQTWYDSEFAAEARGALGLAVPEAGPYRASWASTRCDRALWYSLRGTEPSNPPTIADAWRFGLGHAVHDMLQKVAELMFPGAQSEVQIDLRPIGIQGSAHADMIIEHEGKKLLVEIKTKGGYQFKMKSSTFRGPPEGPDTGEVLQAAVAAKAADCYGVVLVYLAMENVNKNDVYWTTDELGRFCAEWHYTVEELEPLIAMENARIAGVLAAAENPESKPPPRRITKARGIPDGAVFTDPEHSMWVKLEGPGSRVIEDQGSSWECGYCRFKDQCIKDGA